MDLASNGRNISATSRAGSNVTVCMADEEGIYGFYEGDIGWIPCKWNSNGTFVDLLNPRGLDITIED